jgi:hypothetical protein
MAVMAVASGCATAPREGLVGGGDASPRSGDGGTPSPDAAGPLADAAPPASADIYVHTADTLYIYDPDAGELSLIGLFETDADDITDLAVAPGGTIYAISNRRLYTVDDATARATFLADVPGLSNVGMTFLPGGVLLATDKDGGVREIEPATGAVTEIGAFGGGFATAGDLVAVADGTLYAISDEGPIGDEFDNNWLLTVDPTTAVASGVGQIGHGGVFGCAYSGGRVYAFTRTGDVIEIDPATGAGSLHRSFPVAFWGAAVTPLVRVD